MGKVVAIIGRPNVGKSTLFNRLIGKRAAIVDSVSGVTRDRHYGTSDWNGKEFTVIDTGGFIEGSDDVFEEAIRKQAVYAAEEADIIIFMVDAKEGLTGFDKDVANLLRSVRRTKLLAVNKVDNNALISDAQEFYALGFDKLFMISSVNGSGTGELLDAVVENLDDESVVSDFPDELPRIAVVGRPNVGKSSLVNKLLGFERSIVTDIPGTTRDAVDTRYQGFGHDFVLIDTAGLRKKSKVHEDIEFYSVMRAIKTIERSDVCILMIDATQGIESQDVNILQLIHKNHKGVVIVINKWDLIEKDTHSTQTYTNQIKERIKPFQDIPIVFVSVTEQQRVLKVLDLAREVYNSKQFHIPTPRLNEYILPIIEKTPPPATSRGKYIRIKYATQLKTRFPAFAFYCNHPRDIKPPYKRFLENKIRERFGFSGVPIELYFREK